MPVSKARKAKLKKSFSKGTGGRGIQLSQRRKPKKADIAKALAISWYQQIVSKIVRKRPEVTPEFEIQLENGLFLVNELGLAYIIAE